MRAFEQKGARMKKTTENNKHPALKTAVQKPLHLISKFIKKPATAMTVAEKRDAENMGITHAGMRNAEQEMLSLSMLSHFGEAQEQMLNNRMAQMMHKIGNIKLPFLRLSFMARSRRLLGRQQPRIEASKADKRKPKRSILKPRLSPYLPF